MTKQFNPCVKCKSTEIIWQAIFNEGVGEMRISCLKCECHITSEGSQLIPADYDLWNKANPLPVDEPLKKCCGEEPGFFETKDGLGNYGHKQQSYDCLICGLSTGWVTGREAAFNGWQALDHKPAPERTKSCGNVFEDLGLEEAESLRVRSELMLKVRGSLPILSEHKIVNAAKHFGVDYTVINDLVEGRIDCLSSDRLIDMLAKVGVKVKIEFLEPEQGDGKCTQKY